MLVSYVWELFGWAGCKDERKNWYCDRQSWSHRTLKKEAQTAGSSCMGQQLAILWQRWATNLITGPAINAGAHISHSWRRGFLRGPYSFKEEDSPMHVRCLPASCQQWVSLMWSSFLCWSHPWHCCTDMRPKSCSCKAPFLISLGSAASLTCITHWHLHELLPHVSQGFCAHPHLRSLSDVALHQVPQWKPGRRNTTIES